MRIKANSLLQYLVPIIGIIVVFLGVRACQSDSATPLFSEAENKAPHLTPEQMKALGIEAEGPEDTVSTLVAQVHKMRDELETTQVVSERLREQNRVLAEKANLQQNELQQAVSQALANQRERQQVHEQAQIQSLKELVDDKLSHLKATLTIDTKGNDSQKVMPVGLGLHGKNPFTNNPLRLTWVKPLEIAAARPSQASAGGKQGGSVFATAFSSGANAVSPTNVPPALVASKPKPKPTPAYTIPKNSTLAGSVAMSALIGRVPRNGKLQNPYPFKIIIGVENLIANGIQLPEVKGAVVSGFASGDWTLSCVRGTVRSITFIFQDGTVQTVPKPAKPGRPSRNQQAGSGNRNFIGYLSNPAGIPCIPGQRKTNFRAFLATSVLLSSASAAADAFSLGETQTSISGFGAVTGVTGNVGKYIAGQATSQGVKDVKKWIKERFSQNVDAVYVPPGQPVAVNITRMLPIDYKHKGRKVHHYANYMSSLVPPGLD